jgi:RNA polymerase sigma factor (sigma-70 family)
MSQVWPETRHTLIARLRDTEDQVAWGEFVLIYEPLIMRFALRHGLQHADAVDICQRVLWSVARAADDWNVGRDQGSFRGWLAKVTRNAVINLLQRETKHWGNGDSRAMDLLGQIPEGMDDTVEAWGREHQTQVLKLAAAQVKERFQSDSWELFWRTTVGNEPIESVAATLNKSIGAAYAIRSRILLAIRDAAKSLQGREEMGDQQ